VKLSYPGQYNNVSKGNEENQWPGRLPQRHINVQEKVREIHVRISHEAAESVPASAARSELGALRNSYGRLHQIRNAVGEMPASPYTIRARLGGCLIRIVQRMLFWYTPHIVRFHDETANVLDSACNLLERQMRQIEANTHERQILRAGLFKLSSGLSLRYHGLPQQEDLPVPATGGARDMMLASFRLAGPIPRFGGGIEREAGDLSAKDSCHSRASRPLARPRLWTRGMAAGRLLRRSLGSRYRFESCQRKSLQSERPRQRHPPWLYDME
jgi:hypothetical protein